MGVITVRGIDAPALPTKAFRVSSVGAPRWNVGARAEPETALSRGRCAAGRMPHRAGCATARWHRCAGAGPVPDGRCGRPRAGAVAQRGQLSPGAKSRWRQSRAVQASRSWATVTMATHAWLRTKSSKGKLRNPHALAQRMRSSTRAWRRWRSSRAGGSPTESVRKQVWRKPSLVSNNDSWAPGWGRSRRQIEPGTRRPGPEVGQVGQLDHPRSRAARAVALDGGHPVLLLGQQQGVADAIVHVEAYGVADVALHQGVEEAVGGAGGVGPGQDGVHRRGRVVARSVAGPPLGRELGQGGVEHLHVIGGGVAGVAGPQHGGQGLVGLVAPHAQGMEAEPPFVGRRGVLLVGGGRRRGWRRSPR